jgi:hypothetical protein
MPLDRWIDQANFVIDAANKLMERACPIHHGGPNGDGHVGCRYCGCSIREGKHHESCVWNNLKIALEKLESGA